MINAVEIKLFHAAEFCGVDLKDDGLTRVSVFSEENKNEEIAFIELVDGLV